MINLKTNLRSETRNKISSNVCVNSALYLWNIVFEGLDGKHI